MAEKIMLSHQVRGVDLSCLAVVSVLKLLKHTTRAHTHTHRVFLIYKIPNVTFYQEVCSFSFRAQIPQI